MIDRLTDRHFGVETALPEIQMPNYAEPEPWPVEVLKEIKPSEKVMTQWRWMMRLDAGVASHNWGTAHLAKHFAECLGWKKARVKELFQCGLLHDIGEVSDPDIRSLILLPRPLTPEESEKMKKHTRYGYAALQDEGLYQESIVARDHHESWIGGGYPDNKMGKEIGTNAQLIAFIDWYDALRRERPYKRVYSIEEALRNTDRQFQIGRFNPKYREPFASVILEAWNHPILWRYI